MEWYIKKGVPLSLNHFELQAIDSGDWEKKSISLAEFQELLEAKIKSADFSRIKADISRFISDPKYWTSGHLSIFRM